jgi:hypothetical protein
MSCGLLVIITAVLALLLPSHLASSNGGSGSQVTLIGVLVFVVVAAASAGFALIATKVYWGNSWIVTSDSITQVVQSSLFSRQSSQLSLGNLEDVSAEQNGILAHMFNYGVLRVETAGDRTKFMFLYCPNPNYYAQQILSAREEFEQGAHGETGAPQSQPAPAYQQPLTGPPSSSPSTGLSPVDYPGSDTDSGVNIGT